MKNFYLKIKDQFPVALSVILAQTPNGSTSPPPISTPSSSLPNDIYNNLNYFGSAVGFPSTSLMTIITNIVNIALSLLGIIMVLLIIYAGFLWMTSGANDEQRAKARSTIGGAVVGLIIILAAYSIVQFVISAITGSVAGGATPTP